MGKNKKAHVKQAAPEGERAPLTLGSFEIKQFDGLEVVFGARLADYPPMDAIPDEFRRGSGKFQRIFSALFYSGGSLAAHGLKFRPGIDQAAAMASIRAWMGSFDPKHEHKTATVAWALSEWTEPV